MILAVPSPLTIAMVASPHYSRTPRASTQAIVLHATCGGEGTTAAEACAKMFADPLLEPKRSAHYVVDSDSAVQCVGDMFPAWHCGHTGNQRSIGIELCGQASQTAEQWLDEASLPTLCRAARLVADLCRRWSIPVQLADAAALKRGDRGITTHDYVRQAWGETTHTDPGPHFPLADFLAAVRAA